MKTQRGRGRAAENGGKEMRSLWRRHFWALACGVVLVSILTRTFDYSLWPLSYRGVFITRPYCGLHSDIIAERAWAARSHVKYGLGYTKGFDTLVVGDPPPEHRRYSVGHPPLQTWITAIGVRLLGTEDWAIRVFDLILSVPILLVTLYMLRELYGDVCALLSGLLFVMLPYSGYSAFDWITMGFGLWALWRYLLVTGRLAGTDEPKKRHYVELVLALFLAVQSSWIGVFYAMAITIHYGVTSLLRRRVQWPVLAIIAVIPVVGVAIDLGVIMLGYRANLRTEAATATPKELVFDRGGILPARVVEVKQETEQTACSLMKTQFRRWQVGDRSPKILAWKPWLARNIEHARDNVTAAVLVFWVGYFLYAVGRRIVLGGRRVFSGRIPSRIEQLDAVHRPFAHLWFFLLPGLLFLLTFKGLTSEYSFWQAPLVFGMTIGAILMISLIGDVLSRVQWMLGRFAVVFLVAVLVVFCNRGLCGLRRVGEQSPQTIGLFKYLNQKVPADKAVLTFQDFMVRPMGVEVAHFEPVYAWYLDREMAVANAWQYDRFWARSAQIDAIAAKTVHEVRRQAETGRFSFYCVPAQEEPDRDPLQSQLFRKQIHAALETIGLTPGLEPNEQGLLLNNASETLADVDTLTTQELERRLNDLNRDDDIILCWEKHRRYREGVIARLKQSYPYVYYDNQSLPGDGNFCYRGHTPCYLFDLVHRKE